MSTWSAEPEDVALDAPIWPDISNRYDTFGMELHEVALVGDGPSAVPR
jgi:hypothetical protein